MTLVEGDRRACDLARQNAGEQPATIVRADVDRWVERPGALAGADLVVLDPPRTGAKAAVVAAIAQARPRAVAYVACDPVALARDVATFAEHGMDLVRLAGPGPVPDDPSRGMCGACLPRGDILTSR